MVEVPSRLKAKSGEIPALSRNCNAPRGDESGRLPRPVLLAFEIKGVGTFRRVSALQGRDFLCIQSVLHQSYDEK